MTEEQHAWLERADQALQDAHLLRDAGSVEACLNRAYYASFYAAQAALLGVSERPKTHSGTHARFALHFVPTGRLAKATGSLLTRAFQTRLLADYDAVIVTDTNAAADALADAEAFVTAVRPLVVSP